MDRRKESYAGEAVPKRTRRSDRVIVDKMILAHVTDPKQPRNKMKMSRLMGAARQLLVRQ